MIAKGLGPSPVCSTLARSGKVFLRMAMAAETLADDWESLSCMISASVSIASGVNFSHKARTSGSRFGRPPGLPLTPFGNGLPLPGIFGCSCLLSVKFVAHDVFFEPAIDFDLPDLSIQKSATGIPAP